MMNDKFDPKNPMLQGTAIIRIGLMKPTPDSPTGSIISDVRFRPEINYKSLTPDNMAPHVVLAGVATKAIRDFLEMENNGQQPPSN